MNHLILMRGETQTICKKCCASAVVASRTIRDGCRSPCLTWDFILYLSWGLRFQFVHPKHLQRWVNHQPSERHKTTLLASHTLEVGPAQCRGANLNIHKSCRWDTWHPLELWVISVPLQNFWQLSPHVAGYIGLHGSSSREYKLSKR